MRLPTGAGSGGPACRKRSAGTPTLAPDLEAGRPLARCTFQNVPSAPEIPQQLTISRARIAARRVRRGDAPLLSVTCRQPPPAARAAAASRPARPGLDMWRDGRWQAWHCNDGGTPGYGGWASVGRVAGGQCPQCGTATCGRTGTAPSGPARGVISWCRAVRVALAADSTTPVAEARQMRRKA